MKIGIDIGGSHIAVGLINNGNIINKKEKDIKNIDRKNIKKFLIDTIVKSINQILKENKITIRKIEKIGMSAPGTIKNGIIIRATNLEIENFNIVEEIQKYFNIEISIRNDAKCATLAEKQYGSMKKYQDFVYLCLGTGIGCGIFMNNQLLHPKKYEGFEFGHTVIEKDGKMCSCGKRGCLENYASMKAFKQSLISNLNLVRTTSSYTLLKLMQNQKGNKKINKIINKVIDEYIENLSLGIENIINIFEPEAICIGGSFVYFKEILLKKLKNKLKQKNSTFNNDIPKIVCAKLQNDAGIIGAVI